MYVLPACHNVGDTIYFPFDTYGADGESITISGLAVTDIEVYKNGGTTQRSSDNGYTLLDTDGIDFDGQVGLHGFSINTGDNSDSGFWADGSQYWVHVSAVTINGQTVRFTYLLPLGLSLRPTTPGRTLDVTATGAAGIDWGNVENQSTVVALSSTSILSVAEATVVGGSVDTVGSVSSDVTVSGGTVTSVTDRVTANVDRVDGVALDTHDAGSFPADVRFWVGSAPNALLSGRVNASVGAWVDLASTADFSDNVRDVLSAHGYTTARAAKLDNADVATSTRASQTSVDDLPTNAELNTALGTADDAVLAAIAALNNVSAAQVATAVLTTAMTEAYRSTGATGTVAQLLYEIIAHLGNSGIIGTTKTLKRLNQTTTAKTFTLDALPPTAIEETS